MIVLSPQYGRPSSTISMSFFHNHTHRSLILAHRSLILAHRSLNLAHRSLILGYRSLIIAHRCLILAILFHYFPISTVANIYTNS